MDTANLIEEAEALSNLPGGTWEFDLATGRIEDRGQGGAGPALIATIHGRDEEALFVVRARTLVPALAAALKASEEQRDSLAAANLAANKRIVELEREADRLITQRDRWEEQVGDMAASVGCEEEFSNWHDHKDCVEERVAVLETERDAARTELARLTTPQPCEPLDMDCGDNSCMFATVRGGMRTNGGCRCLESLGFRRGPHDSLRRMAAEIVSLRKRLSDLTTPRPIAEAPRDGTWILGCWPESGEWLPIVMRWTGKEWQREDPAERDEGYMPTHYLPLPEVKP